MKGLSMNIRAPLYVPTKTESTTRHTARRGICNLTPALRATPRPHDACS